MSGAVLADTHIFLWYLDSSPRLRDSARAALEDAVLGGDPILVSAVTLVEVRYLAEKGTLAEPQVDAIHAAVEATGSSFTIVPVDAAVAWAVGRVPRSAVPDPWDRMIAATALAHDVPLVTYDRKLRSVSELRTVT